MSHSHLNDEHLLKPQFKRPRENSYKVDAQIEVSSGAGPDAKRPRMDCGLTTAPSVHCSSASVAHRLKQNALRVTKTTPIDETSSVCSPPPPPQSGVVVTSATSVPRQYPPKLNGLQQNSIRVIAQFLRDVGLNETVEALVGESGCKVEDSHAVRLRSAIQGGRWNDALALINNCYAQLSERQVMDAKIVILEEKFLDLIYGKQSSLALQLLREEFPAKAAKKKAMMCKMVFMSPAELNASMDYNRYRKRRKNMKTHDIRRICGRLQHILPTSFMLPPARLEQIFEQAWMHQTSRCPSHMHLSPDTASNASMMFNNHRPCIERRSVFRKTAERNLPKEHKDDTWIVKFSPNGELLATAAHAHSVHLWRIDKNGAKMHQERKIVGARDTKQTAGGLAWSSDNNFIAVCGVTDAIHHLHRAQNFVVPTPRRNAVYIFDVRRGILHTKITASADVSISTVSFFPHVPGSDVHTLVSAGNRGHLQIHEITRTGHQIKCAWERYRVVDLHACKDGNSILAADSLRRVRMYKDFTNRGPKTDVIVVMEEAQIMSMAVHPSEELVLLTCKNVGIRMWSIKTKSLIRTFKGVNHDRKVINACFGGYRNRYIASGNVDCQINVWRMEDSIPMATIKGHTGAVNSVSWSPTDRFLIASASDDMTCRLWSCQNKGPEKAPPKAIKKALSKERPEKRPKSVNAKNGTSKPHPPPAGTSTPEKKEATV